MKLSDVPNLSNKEVGIQVGYRDYGELGSAITIAYRHPTEKVNGFTLASIAATNKALEAIISSGAIDKQTPIILMGDVEKGFNYGGDGRSGDQYLDAQGLPAEELQTFHKILGDDKNGGRIVNYVNGKAKAGGIVQLCAGGYVIAEEGLSSFQTLNYQSDLKKASDDYTLGLRRAVNNPGIEDFWLNPRQITDLEEAKRIGLVDWVLDPTNDTDPIPAVLAAYQALRNN